VSSGRSRRRSDYGQQEGQPLCAVITAQRTAITSHKEQKKEEDFHLPLFCTQRNTFFRTNSWKTWNVYIVSVSIFLRLKSRGKAVFLRDFPQS
jgi:hypothetical protein